MSTYLSDAVQAGLDAARIKSMRSSSKLRIETPDGYYRVLKLWENGFSVAAEDAPHLRGFVDLYDGPTQLFQCLILAAEEEAGIMNYEFKRLTAVVHNPPRDFASDTEAPVGLIENAGMTA